MSKNLNFKRGNFLYHPQKKISYKIIRELRGDQVQLETLSPPAYRFVTDIANIEKYGYEIRHNRFSRKK